MAIVRRPSYQWPAQEIVSIRTQLEDLAEVVQHFDGDNGVAAYLARFLVVRSCGYVEQTSFEVCRGYVREKSGGLVRSFAHSWLERTRNPTSDNLIELVGRFDSTKCNDFQVFLDEDDQRLRRELDFLVDRRNRIAHGLNEGLASRKAIVLFEISKEVASWFISEFDPG